MVLVFERIRFEKSRKCASLLMTQVSFAPQQPAETPWLSSSSIGKIVKKIKLEQGEVPSQVEDPEILDIPLQTKIQKAYKKLHRVGKKLTRGAAKRTRYSPSQKRTVIEKFAAVLVKQKEMKCATIANATLLERIAKEENIPVSNVKSWVRPKHREKILKAAGILDACEVMGVKQRKMTKQVKTLLKDSANESMAPLLAHMDQET